MPEAIDFCPKCGTNLEPDSVICPGCGASMDPSVPDARPQGGILANRTVWLAGGAAAVAAVVAGLYFGGVFGPNGNDICTATLNQARDYGVISPNATLAGSSAKSTDVENRKQCTAKVGDDTYTLLADIKGEDVDHKKCRDIKKQLGCVALYSVARSDGVTTYQVRDIPPGEADDAALASASEHQAPAGDSAGAPAGAPPGAPSGDQGALDSETAVDNSGGMPAAPAQSAPAQPAAPPQQ